MNCRDFPENFQDKERFSETGTWKPAGKRGLFFLSPERNGVNLSYTPFVSGRLGSSRALAQDQSLPLIVVDNTTDDMWQESLAGNRQMARISFVLFQGFLVRENQGESNPKA